MGRWSSALHPRGKGGRFVKKGGGGKSTGTRRTRRRARKINKLQSTNDRVLKSFKSGEFNNIKGTSLERQIVQRVLVRDYQIHKLKQKQVRAGIAQVHGGRKVSASRSWVV